MAVVMDTVMVTWVEIEEKAVRQEMVTKEVEEKVEVVTAEYWVG